MKATPSLRLSLAAKPNDLFTLLFPNRDSVTFPTARYGFDINRIKVMKPKYSHTESLSLGLKGLSYLSETVS